MADAVAAWVADHDRASFVDLQRAMSEYMPTDGDHALSMTDKPNGIAWLGMSEELVTILRSLLATSRIHMRQADVLVYAFDGAVPNMPVATRVPKGDWPEPTWIPCLLRPGRAPGIA